MEFDWGAPCHARAVVPPVSGKKARRLERQKMVVRRSTTATTVHGEAARADKAQLCSVVHVTHYKACFVGAWLGHLASPAFDKFSLSFRLA
jgi:hypothetical protein